MAKLANPGARLSRQAAAFESARRTILPRSAASQAFFLAARGERIREDKQELVRIEGASP